MQLRNSNKSEFTVLECADTGILSHLDAFLTVNNGSSVRFLHCIIDLNAVTGKMQCLFIEEDDVEGWMMKGRQSDVRLAGGKSMNRLEVRGGKWFKYKKIMRIWCDRLETVADHD